MKKIISLLLTVVMLVSMIIVPTTAVEGNAAIRYSGANIDITGSSRFQHSYCYVPVDYDFVKRINKPGDELHGKWDFTMVMDFMVEDYGTGSDHFTDLTFANWDLGKWHIGYSFTHKAFVIYDLYMPGSDPNAGHYMLAQMSYDLQLDTWYELTMKYYGRTITLYLNGVEMLVADLEYLYNTVKGEDPVHGTIGTWDWQARDRAHELAKDFFFMTAVDMDVCFDNIGWFSGDYDIATGTASKTYYDIDGDFASFSEAGGGAEEGGGRFACFNHNANFKLDPNAGTEKVTYNRGEAAGHKHEWVLDSANSPAVSCLAPGYDLYVCKNGCGASEQRNYLAPLGHAPGMTIRTLLPCDDANHGVDLKMCTRNGCGMTYNALMPLTDTTNGALHGYTSGGTGIYNGCIVASGIGEIAAMDDGFVLEFDVMPISNVGKDFCGYDINLGNNGVGAVLGYNFFEGAYYIDINNERVETVEAAVNEYSWYRWDVVRDGLTIALYVDNELVISAELPEEIYKITDDNGNPIYDGDGKVTTKAVCYNADFRTPGCEAIFDNIVLASPDFDFANTRAGVIYDKLSFNGDFVDPNDGFIWGQAHVLAAIKYDKIASAGYKFEAYGRPFEDVTEIHDDRALHIDSNYEDGSMWGYSQLLGDYMDTFKNNVDLELTFDFYAYDWCTDEALLDKKLTADEDHISSAFIGTHINSQGVGDEQNTLGNGFVGYDFIKQAAVIGSVSEQAGGYYGDDNTTFIPYAIEKDTWHNYTISYKTEFVDDDSYDNDFYVASIYIDGNLVHSVNLDLWTINADYIIFFPNFVKGYLDNLTVNLGGVKLDDNRQFTNEVSKKTTGWDFMGNDWTLVSGGVPTHVYEKTVFPASCLTDGYTNYVCACGESNYTLYDQIAQGHSYDDGVVTLEPTGTSTGIMTYTCTVCGDYYEEEIAKAFIYGDVDNNGAVNGNDLIALAKVANGASITGFNSAAADVDGNGAVNGNDLILLAKAANGANVTLGPKA